MPRAFLTGATGFIGGALLRALLARGWEVRVLARAGSDSRNLSGHSGTLDRFEGDLLDAAGLERGLHGCDVLFHAAARYSLWNPRPAEIYAANVDGTRNVLAAARRQGVSRVVYTSTVGTIQLPPDGRPADESRMAELPSTYGHYKRSKILAELEARRFAADGLPLVIVHPTAPVGPFDLKPTPTGEMIVDYLRGKMRAYTDTGLNIVAVEDVAVGHIQALEHGRPGEGYILGGENLSLLRIFQGLSEATGIPAPRMKLGRGALVPIAFVSEAFARLTRRPPLISREAAHLASKFMYFSSEKAIREIGYRPGSAHDALVRAVEWFRHNGYAAGKGRAPEGRGPACEPEGAPAGAAEGK